MVMFATEFDTDEFLIAIVDRGNTVKMDFKSIRCNDDGTESIDRSETFWLNKTGISAYLFAVPNHMKENGGWFIQFMTRTEMYWRKLLIKYNFTLDKKHSFR